MFRNKTAIFSKKCRLSIKKTEFRRIVVNFKQIILRFGGLGLYLGKFSNFKGTLEILKKHWLKTEFLKTIGIFENTQGSLIYRMTGGNCKFFRRNCESLKNSLFGEKTRAFNN